MRETVIRVLVPVKLSSLKQRPTKRGRSRPKKVRRIPRSLPIITKALGQTVTVHLPTDVEVAPTFTPTIFRAGTGMASAYAVWDEGGTRRLGVITAAHVAIPGADGYVPVEIEGPSTVPEKAVTTPGRIRMKSDLAKTGFDVSLVEINPNERRLIDAGPYSASIASESVLTSLLGDVNDEVATEGYFWASGSPMFRAEAFFHVYHMPLEGGGRLVLKDAVLCNGPRNTFKPGMSGSSWAGRAPDGSFGILAIQSHSNSETFGQSLGTAFFAARDWIRSVPTFKDLQIAWNRVEVLALLNKTAP